MKNTDSRGLLAAVKVIFFLKCRVGSRGFRLCSYMWVSKKETRTSGVMSKVCTKCFFSNFQEWRKINLDVSLIFF